MVWRALSDICLRPDVCGTFMPGVVLRHSTALLQLRPVCRFRNTELNSYVVPRWGRLAPRLSLSAHCGVRLGRCDGVALLLHSDTQNQCDASRLTAGYDRAACVATSISRKRSKLAPRNSNLVPLHHDKHNRVTVGHDAHTPALLARAHTVAAEVRLYVYLAA